MSSGIHESLPEESSSLSQPGRIALAFGSDRQKPRACPKCPTAVGLGHESAALCLVLVGLLAPGPVALAGLALGCRRPGARLAAHLAGQPRSSGERELPARQDAVVLGAQELRAARPDGRSRPCSLGALARGDLRLG